ncbi:CCHC-type domain-containing protein [Durusdinium trenchii]|uniref:CCHC-type domain-containing protein n=1 Tax=Durusdinium trenchii TaxID=1381693 RepID=A0ABP0P4W6_9DINO
MIEIDGHRLSHGFDQTHYMHFTARKGHCGMDFFWSHFWPMYKSNLTLLGLFQAAREASEPLQVLHVEKSCRLLPAEELKALLCDALMPSPGESGCVPSDHAAVQRVYVWRRRALQAAQRLPSEKMLGGEGHEGDEASTDLLHGNSRREEDLDWAYQGDLQEEANAPYVDRWRTGSVSQQDWFRLIGKAEFWLAHAFLELNRREPGLGHPLQAACEVLTSGLSSGRLTESLPGCRAILGRARKADE